MNHILSEMKFSMEKKFHLTFLVICLGINILNNYPVYGSFTWSNGRHAGVVYGINSIGGYIYIMDPEFGFTSASVSSSGYTYVSSYSMLHLH